MIVPKLHDVLFERGINRADLAEKTGVSENWLSKLYYGKLNTVHIPSIQKICNMLNVKQSDIVDVLPDHPPKHEMHGVEGEN